MRTKRLSPRDLIFSSLDQVRFFSFTSVGALQIFLLFPRQKSQQQRHCKFSQAYNIVIVFNQSPARQLKNSSNSLNEFNFDSMPTYFNLVSYFKLETYLFLLSLWLFKDFDSSVRKLIGSKTSSSSTANWFSQVVNGSSSRPSSNGSKLSGYFQRSSTSSAASDGPIPTVWAGLDWTGTAASISDHLRCRRRFCRATCAQVAWCLSTRTASGDWSTPAATSDATPASSPVNFAHSARQVTLASLVCYTFPFIPSVLIGGENIVIQYYPWRPVSHEVSSPDLQKPRESIGSGYCDIFHGHLEPLAHRQPTIHPSPPNRLRFKK